MPALVHFNRKWLIASDDFVFPSAIETVVRLVWLVASVVVTWVNFSDCSKATFFIKYFFYGITGNLVVTFCLCIGIFIISSRGSTFETQKRTHLSKILYVKYATILIDLALLCFGAWILLHEPNLCSQWKIFIEYGIVGISLYILFVILGACISYDVMGSSFYWNTPNTDNSAEIFRKAEKVWYFRLKCFFCCANVSEDENDFVYAEISSFVSTLAPDIDLVPSDLLAGLIILCKKHAVEKRKFKLTSESDAQLANRPKPSWMTVENALYYLRIAKSTYGWIAFFNPLCPWKLCTLLSPSRCCRGLIQPETSTIQGDPFFCDSSAVEKISGISDSDVLYASFSNSISEPAFIITYDHTKRAVIIAIRGTISLSDFATSINANAISLPDEVSSSKVMCHRGVLQSALFIKKKINDLKVLQTAFSENPSYNLVITGHSLGASIASILGLLFHQEYPFLQCYCYAPVAALSANGLEQTFDFVFSIVVDDDIIPRCCGYSFKELIKQMYTSLEETQVPKHKLLLKPMWNYIKKIFNLSQKVTSTSEVYENKQVEINDEAPTEEVRVDITCKETQLYAPGRILCLKSPDGLDPSWITGICLQKIIITPFMIKNHQPHQIQFLLEKCKCAESALQSSVQESLYIQHM